MGCGRRGPEWVTGGLRARPIWEHPGIDFVGLGQDTKEALANSLV